MSDAKKAAVVGVWAATLLAGFVGARLFTQPESATPPDDFGAEIRAVLAEKDGLDRMERAAAVLQHLNSDNVAEAAAVYDRLLNLLNELDIRPFALAWARFDPEAALQHTLRWRFPDQQKMGASAAIEGWAMRDPVGALQAYEKAKTENPSISEDMFLNLLSGWLYSGEGGLVEYVANLSEYKREVAISRVVGKVMRNGDTEGAISWVEAIIQDDAYEMPVKRRVFRRGIRIVGRSDPAIAAAWTMEHHGQDYAVDAPRIAAGRWATKDGPAAMQWVKELPDGELTHLAIREAFLSWYRGDRESAVAWLEAETLTAFHGPAIDYYANALSKRKPEEAIAWCERILDSERQLRCLKPAAVKWFQRDAAAAEAWLQQSPLDEAARSAARKPPLKKKQQRRSRPGQPNLRRGGQDNLEGGVIEVVPGQRTPQ
jgi:tetratricopeptide (TPR) repeat protein